MAFTDPLIGKRLGDYSIESVLGTGGMARVYRGYDDNLDRYAAIKVIEPQLIASAEEDEYRERFLREARAIARLNHNRIVSVYQFNQVGNLYYIAMEYIEGDNLRDILKGYLKQGRLIPTDELMLVLRDIADALDYAHKQGIIHRDIKPSNIIVTPDGNAVLTDFGLALNAVEGTIGNTFGSVHYIAPEQAISSAQAVPASDQYSLGIVAYELLTGRVPFDDASAMSVALKHISDPPPPPTEINPNIPAEVEQVLLKALDKEPNRRYESAKDFVRSLELAFEMSKAGDIAAPKSIVEALGAPPKTNPVPPPSRLSTDSNIKTTNAPMLIDENSVARRNTASIPLAENGRAGWFVAALLVVLILLIGGYVFFSQMQINNANSTSTAEAVAIQASNIAATSTALESTSIAFVARETNDAETEIAQATSSAEALSERETANAFATANEATNDAATARAQASEDAQATTTAEAQSTQEALASATVEAEETRSAATSQAEALQGTNAATTAQAIAVEGTNTAQARMAAVVSPTTTDVPRATASNTAVPTFTASPTITPLPTLTATPNLLISDENDTAQVMLRYDGRMLILGNRDTVNSIDVSELVFVQVAPDEDGIFRETIVFNVARTELVDAASDVADSRCLEIIDSNQFSTLPSQNPLAIGLCSGTPFWVTTVSPFWINESSQAYFEVRLGTVDVLTRCPVQRPLTRAELRCSIDLNAIP